MKKELIQAIKAAEEAVDRLQEARLIANGKLDTNASLCIALAIERQQTALTLLKQIEEATDWD